MKNDTPIYVVGAGAVGLPLAAFLADAGRNVIAVRTRRTAKRSERIVATIRDAAGEVLRIPVETVALTALKEVTGVIVVAVKSYANADVAAAVAANRIGGPLVILQNGLGIEEPFLRGSFDQIHRGVLYVANQSTAEHDVSFRALASSAIGLVRGTAAGLAECVSLISTPRFPFHPEPDIRRDVWRKVIVNCVFNSICPVLDIDNGVFARDADVAALAREIIRECVAVARAQGAPITEAEVMERVQAISRGSEGVQISTLQDIRCGRETEVDTLNLAVARMAQAVALRPEVGKTELLGRLVQAKARQHRLLQACGDLAAEVLRRQRLLRA